MNKALIALAAFGLFAVGCDGPDPTTPMADGLGVTLQADMGPDGSQRLRGLGDRVFEVHVEQISGPPIGPPEFDNCYSFLADGTWIDPLFPVPGTWTQHSRGAATPYTGTAELQVPEVIAITLVQEGTVTPAGGKGILQLEALTTVVVDEAGETPFEVLFLSQGQEVDVCPFEL